MTSVDPKRLEEFRAETFRLRPGLKLTDIEEAISFVRQRGFVYFWPIKDIELPSLWEAVAGDRPVADAHDDPGHVTWGWKDSLLGKRRWFYNKVLRKKATIISLETLPYFYALSQNFGSPEEDHIILYEEGKLSSDARSLYQALLDEGPLDTLALRRASRLSVDTIFNRALTELQADFKVMPIGVAEVGAWKYAFIYELVARHHPEVLESARMIGEITARTLLSELYFRSVGAASLRDVVKLFGWRPAEAERALLPLVEKGIILAAPVPPAAPGYSLPELTV